MSVVDKVRTIMPVWWVSFKYSYINTKVPTYLTHKRLNVNKLIIVFGNKSRNYETKIHLQNNLLINLAINKLKFIKAFQYSILHLQKSKLYLHTQNTTI